ncbi:7219_t:CDS:2, partial [Racocetra fulgida]
DVQFVSKLGSNSEETVEEEPKKVFERHRDNLVNKLKSCCLCKKKCSNKISLDLLQSLALENAFYRFRRWVQEKQSMLPSFYENTDHSPVIKLQDDLELSKIVIKKPSKDVCDKYTLFKHALKERSNVNENLNDQFATHIYDYRAIREAYKNDIQIAKKFD